MVPGRGPYRPEKQDHPSLGQARHPAFSAQGSEDQIRTFSGKATYTGTIRLGKPSCAKPVFWLDVGAMADVARVRMNGIETGIIWTQPHRLNVTSLIKAGRNVLEIEVANLWVNRLVGEAALNPLSTGAKMYRPNGPLRRAGLKGPVRVLMGCK